MSRSLQFPDQKFELEMDVSMANDQKLVNLLGPSRFRDRFPLRRDRADRAHKWPKRYRPV